jgi:hypothetical protein
MSLPRAVIAAEEKAEQALQQLKASMQASQSEVAPQEQYVQEDIPTDSVQTLQDAVPAEQVEQPEVAPQSEEDQKWEARYKSLNGKYTAEVPRLASANKELQAQLSRLQKQVEDLRNAKPRETLVKPEEVQEYGEPLVDLIRRAAREELSDKDILIDDLRARLESFEATSTKNTELSFYEKLNVLVPDWTEINDDKAFHQWLDQYDDLAGQRRQDLLLDAEGAKDANRVANFFNSWKKTNTQRAATSNRSLESQVVPSTTVSQSKPPGKKIWTRPEIAEFYQRARVGDISSEQMVAIEADIHAAQIEKRIR